MDFMMGAAFQARLEALMTGLEPTCSQGMLVPVMLAIIITDMAPDPFFNTRSLFDPKMKILELEFQQNPLLMTLNRANGAQALFVNRNRGPPLESSADILNLQDIENFC